MDWNSRSAASADVAARWRPSEELIVSVGIKAIPVDLSAAVPPLAKRVTLRYRTVPHSSFLLLYATPASEPLAVSGEGEIELGIIGQKIYVQKSRDVRESTLEVIGFAI